MAQQEKNSRESADYQALAGKGIHNQLWRERVAQWCYDVLDYLEESRDVAHVAMSFLDRYLAVLATENSNGGEVQPFEFEVISFTSLFLAIRVCGRNKNLQIPELLQLSKLLALRTVFPAPVAVQKQVAEITSFMREVELGNDEVKALREELTAAQAPLQEKLDAIEAEQRAQEEARRQQEVRGGS